MMTLFYDCRLCRRARLVRSMFDHKKCRQRGYCDDCAASGLFRFRCHIARIEHSILNADNTPGGRLRELATAHPDRREVYRSLYRKRTAQLEAAQKLLQVPA